LISSGTWVTGGGANPTLTLSALALRTAGHIAGIACPQPRPQSGKPAIRRGFPRHGDCAGPRGWSPIGRYPEPSVGRSVFAGDLRPGPQSAPGDPPGVGVREATPPL